MDDTIKNEALSWYENLEEQLHEFCRNITPAGNNLNVWSSKLAAIIVDACELLDSIWRHSLPQEVRIDGKIKDKSKLNITDFATLFAKKYELPSFKAIFLISPPEYRVPYKSWDELARGGDYKLLPWWYSYTDLKHNKLERIEEATLNTSIDALCGLILAIAKLPNLAKAMLRKGWLKYILNPKDVIRLLESGDIGHVRIMLETPYFFAIPLGSDQLPDDIRDFKPILYGGSKRLINFFGRY